ncbi:hypothetical protein TNCV_3030341 [Trichonephila clavipes]|nr:hypothetical protein TNCV_3030341 [Trichonephila clavipes]
MVWEDTYPPAPEGNRLQMKRAVEKGSRIVNWRIRWSVRSGMHPCAPLSFRFATFPNPSCDTSLEGIHVVPITSCYFAQRQTQFIEFNNIVTFPCR